MPKKQHTGEVRLTQDFLDQMPLSQLEELGFESIIDITTKGDAGNGIQRYFMKSKHFTQGDGLYFLRLEDGEFKEAVKLED